MLKISFALFDTLCNHFCNNAIFIKSLGNSTINSILNQYVKFTRFHVRNMIKFFNATKFVSCTFFNATKVTLISYFFVVSIFQRFVTKSFAPSLSLHFVKRRLLLPHLQPLPPLLGTFAPFLYIKNEFATHFV